MYVSFEWLKREGIQRNPKESRRNPEGKKESELTDGDPNVLPTKPTCFLDAPPVGPPLGVTDPAPVRGHRQGGEAGTAVRQPGGAEEQR